MANKPEIKQTNKQTKTRIVEKKRKREKNKTTTLSEKKEEARNVSEQRDKGWIHVICVQPTTTRQGNRRSRTTLHNERMNGSLNIETTPLTRTS